MSFFDLLTQFWLVSAELPVTVVVAPIGKVLGAVCALEGPLSRVDPLMGLKMENIKVLNKCSLHFKTSFLLHLWPFTINHAVLFLTSQMCL